MKSGRAVWAATVIVGAAVAAIVAMDLFAGEGEGNLPLLIGFVAPTVAALLAASKATENSQALKTIEGQLNGELDKRIEAAVKAALEKYQCAKLPRA